MPSAAVLIAALRTANGWLTASLCVIASSAGVVDCPPGSVIASRPPFVAGSGRTHCSGCSSSRWRRSLPGALWLRAAGRRECGGVDVVTRSQLIDDVAPDLLGQEVGSGVRQVLLDFIGVAVLGDDDDCRGPGGQAAAELPESLVFESRIAEFGR